MGEMVYRYITYYVRLEEGVPPKDYYEYKAKKSPHEWLETYVQDHRSKFIHKW